MKAGSTPAGSQDWEAGILKILDILPSQTNNKRSRNPYLHGKLNCISVPYHLHGWQEGPVTLGVETTSLPNKYAKLFPHTTKKSAGIVF